MVKSPEQYLSNLSFAPPVPDDAHRALTPVERIFVEKYLGEDELAQLQMEPMPQLAPEPQFRPSPPVAEMEAPIIEVAKAQAPVPDIVVGAPQAVETQTAATEAPVVEVVTAEAPPAAPPAPPVLRAEEAVEQAQESLRDRLKREAQLHVVSFFVAGQLFLLPVATIQEVLRHMELVKVPQAPEFVAGVINLRGRVTPLVHLTSLLTNEPAVYSEKNFIIICGSDNLQLGLIIDKISGMHMIPQGKLIWNVESKLGDAADFLCALADLDDRVCGVVAPDMITQKILTP